MGFRVWILGFGLKGLDFRVYGLGFEDHGIHAVGYRGNRVEIQESGIQATGDRLWGCVGSTSWGHGFRI